MPEYPPDSTTAAAPLMQAAAPLMQAAAPLMQCRPGCGACCIAPSISSPIPGMPEGKPAFVRCVQLDDSNRCRLFGQPERPAVCLAFAADYALCGDTDQQALELITLLEHCTAD
ncbi:MAG: hypothetical protein ACI9W6_000642 [Motiliproteus sp.]|jgi:hypothetical protein